MDQRKHLEFYNTPDAGRYGRKQLPALRDLVDKLIASLNDPAGAIVAELGAGKGALQRCHRNYIAVDISGYALARWIQGRRIQADIAEIPLTSQSVDMVISIATLEHIPEPERCLEEIDRILKPGGIALLAAAWFCRPWAAEGLSVRPFRELLWRQRIKKATIPIRNAMLYRAAFVLPKRVYWELRYAANPRPLPFVYSRLTPNLEEYVQTDCDAYSSLDPYMVIMYYSSRGYRVLRRENAVSRLLIRHEPVIIRKPLCV